MSIDQVAVLQFLAIDRYVLIVAQLTFQKKVKSQMFVEYCAVKVFPIKPKEFIKVYNFAF